MRSIRKISFLATVVAAVIAVAAPAAASADKLVYENGERVSLGATLTLASSNMRIQGPGGQFVYCNETTLPAEATENTENSAAAVGAGPGSANWCYFRSEPRPTEIELIDLQFTGATTGTIGLKLSQSWYNGIVCEREGSLPITYTPGTNSIHVKGSFPGSWCLTERHFVGDFSLTADYPFAGQEILVN